MPQRINQMTSAELRLAVAEKYGQVASQPDGTHPFPVGRAFAESLGYAPGTLDSLPAAAVGAFAGISNPLAHANLQPGEIVLDLGCGAGLDSLLAARQVGPRGHIHSLDLSVEMLACARSCAAEAGLENISFHHAPAERAPLGDASMDVVFANGIFNLCPAKDDVLRESHRLLRPGGRLLFSEIVIQEPEGDAWAGASCDLGGDRLAGITLEKWLQ